VGSRPSWARVREGVQNAGWDELPVGAGAGRGGGFRAMGGSGEPGAGLPLGLARSMPLTGSSSWHMQQVGMGWAAVGLRSQDLMLGLTVTPTARG
jgi:hypothetical protein